MLHNHGLLGKQNIYFQDLPRICLFLAWNLSKNREILNFHGNESTEGWWSGNILMLSFWTWTLWLPFIFFEYWSTRINGSTVWVNTTPNTPQGKRHIHAYSQIARFHFDGRNPANTHLSTRNVGFPGTAFFMEDLRDFFWCVPSVDIGNNTLYRGAQSTCSSNLSQPYCRLLIVY